jgi:hypothetical protein
MFWFLHFLKILATKFSTFMDSRKPLLETVRPLIFLECQKFTFLGFISFFGAGDSPSTRAMFLLSGARYNRMVESFV